ncbi:hypothetical protein PR048_025474 [Dryococelus australis]|uniref:Uncharacterized protein n=1 Tax=Dryococelus australis TaxID=614101 RepID=A0ABQ9GRG2_9NEOP|nr:hypothetical protein PR048_025474 [Dryococelus australis]
MEDVWLGGLLRGSNRTSSAIFGSTGVYGTYPKVRLGKFYNWWMKAVLAKLTYVISRVASSEALHPTVQHAELIEMWESWTMPLVRGRVGSNAGMKGRRKREIPRKPTDQRHRPARFPHAKIEPDASRLTAQPPWPLHWISTTANKQGQYKARITTERVLYNASVIRSAEAVMYYLPAKFTHHYQLKQNYYTLWSLKYRPLTPTGNTCRHTMREENALAEEQDEATNKTALKGNIPQFAWSDFGKSWETEIRMKARAGTRTRVPPNTSLVFCHCATSLGDTCEARGACCRRLFSAPRRALTFQRFPLSSRIKGSDLRLQYTGKWPVRQKKELSSGHKNTQEPLIFPMTGLQKELPNCFEFQGRTLPRLHEAFFAAVTANDRPCDNYEVHGTSRLRR